MEIFLNWKSELHSDKQWLCIFWFVEQKARCQSILSYWAPKAKQEKTWEAIFVKSLQVQLSCNLAELQGNRQHTHLKVLQGKIPLPSFTGKPTHRAWTQRTCSPCISVWIRLYLWKESLQSPPTHHTLICTEECTNWTPFKLNRKTRHIPSMPLVCFDCWRLFKFTGQDCS